MENQIKYQLPAKDFLHSSYNHEVLRSWYSKLPSINNIIYPVFISDDPNEVTPIESLPGQTRYGYKKVVEFIKPLTEKGLKSVLVFGVLSNENSKDEVGGRAGGKSLLGPAQLGIQELRQNIPQLFILADVCLCAFTSHGHCGILNENGSINNQQTLQRLVEVAVSYIEAGANMIAPSDMMDGRIGAIKQEFLRLGYSNGVMSYSAKFASSYYGPFRDVCKSKPSSGNRKSYQLPVDSKELALKAVDRDIQEGADYIMVKPITTYLDIVADIKKKHDVVIACYNVSGEYAMVCHAAKAGAIDKKAVVLEQLRCFKRAGVDIFITYFAPELLDWLKEDFQF